jgi:Protein of unknown function (DUF732)
MAAMRRVLQVAVVSLTVGPGLALGVATARADNDTQGYLATLHGFGVVDGTYLDLQSDSEALDAGRQTCQSLRSGQSARTVESQLANKYSNPTSEDIIQAAHQYLCPDAPPLHW